MRQKDLTLPASGSLPVGRKAICRDSDPLFLLPWTPIFLVMIDETPNLASAGVRAVATLLVVLVVALDRARRGRSRLPRGRRWSRRSLLESAIWLASGSAVLWLLAEPPALWLDAATIGLAVLAHGLLRGGMPSEPEERP